MSRILRRPMFRGGGKVSSYGNGIASGLGYAPPAAPASPMTNFLTGAAGGAGIMGKLGLFG